MATLLAQITDDYKSIVADLHSFVYRQKARQPTDLACALVTVLVQAARASGWRRELVLETVAQVWAMYEVADEEAEQAAEEQELITEEPQYRH